MAGDKVECRVPEPIRHLYGHLYCACAEVPADQGVYTIRSLHPGLVHVGVTLQEIVNKPCPLALAMGKNASAEDGEPTFPHYWFKPLEHSGMSILRKIASDPPRLPGEDGEPVKKREVETV
jgi:hypothetical protein